MLANMITGSKFKAIIVITVSSSCYQLAALSKKQGHISVCIIHANDRAKVTEVMIFRQIIAYTSKIQCQFYLLTFIPIEVARCVSHKERVQSACTCILAISFRVRRHCLTSGDSSLTHTIDFWQNKEYTAQINNLAS